jgi:hypothetical protein
MHYSAKRLTLVEAASKLFFAASQASAPLIEKLLMAGYCHELRQRNFLDFPLLFQKHYE